ncbi:hypothetical protein P3S67_032535 [Capsicum chacoense]
MATTMDVEMINEKEEKKVSIAMIRKKFEEWDYLPYHYQMWNKDESDRWPPRFWTYECVNRDIECFTDFCKSNESFDFSIEPVVDGEVKHCSYSELESIANFKDSLIQKTLTGRLFRGTIVEGSVSRPAIVKTWDFFLPIELENVPHLYKFCDEIELLTDERSNTHPNLMKLYSCCFDRRLAVVYDAEFTRVLSNVLLDDDFGWDKRMKVATQLADLFSWLHKNGIAVGSVTADCIMIDDEVNIKVFDFGYLSNHVNEDTKISVLAGIGREAPEIFTRTRTMKSDVYIFGLLLLQLISNKEVIYDSPHSMEQRAINEAKCGEKYLVCDFFQEVDHSIAFKITLLAFCCLHDRPDLRPKMEEVFSYLTDLRDGARGEKRKRDENESESESEAKPESQKVRVGI